MSSLKEQIEISIQVNQSIKERLVFLDGIVETQKSQLEACRHLYEQMEILHDDVAATEKRIGGLIPPKPKNGSLNSLTDSLKGISKTSEKNKGFFSHLADAFKMLAKAASGITLAGFSSLGNLFKGLSSIFKTLLSLIPDLGKILFNILAELVKLVVALYDKLIQLANDAFSGGGSSEYYAALQKLKEQYGELSQNAPSSIISMSKNMKAIKDVGLSPFKIFGNRGVMIQEFLEQYATKMGPLFEFYANEFDVTEGALLGMVKGMGLSGEDVEGMSSMAISKGKSLSEEFIENHKIVSKVSKPFTEASKLIHRDIAKATRNIKSFGGATKEAIGAAASFARSIGLNINDLTGIMDTFKDFDTSLETATQYYEILQVRVDTYQMFENQDLGSMLNHLREGFKTAGVETTSLNRAYVSLLGSTSGLDEAAAIQAFSLKNTSADFDDISSKTSKATGGTKTLERALYELRDYIEFKTMSGGGFEASGFFDAWLKGLERAILRNPLVRGLLRDIWSSLKIFYREGTRLFQGIMNAFPGLVDFIQAVRRFFDPQRFSILVKGVNNSFISLIKGTKSGAYTVNHFFKDVGKLFEDHFKHFIKVDDGRLLASLKKTFDSTLTILRMMIEAIGKLLADGIKFLAAVISGDFDISADLKSAFDDTMKGFDKAFQPVASAIEKTIQRIGFAIASLKESFMTLLKRDGTYEKGMTFFQKVFTTIMGVKDKIIHFVNKAIDVFTEYWTKLVDIIIPAFAFISDLFSAHSVFLWGLIFAHFGRNVIARWRGRIPPNYRFKLGKVPTSIRSDSTVKMKDVFKSRKNARLIRGFISSNQINLSEEANQLFKKMVGYDANKSFGMSESKLRWSKLNLQDLTADDYKALRGGKGLEIYEEFKRKGAPDDVLKRLEQFKEVSVVEVEKIDPKKSLSARAFEKIKGTRIGRAVGKAYSGVRDWTRGKAARIKAGWNNSWVGKGLANTVGAVSRAAAPLVNLSKSFATKVANLPGARPVGRVLKFGGGLVGGIVIGIGLGWLIDKLIMDENGEIKKDENGEPIVSESSFSIFSAAMRGLQIWGLATPLGWVIEIGLFVGGFFSDSLKGMSLFHAVGDMFDLTSSIDIARDSIVKQMSENIASQISKNPGQFLGVDSFTKKWRMNSSLDNYLTSDELWNSIEKVWIDSAEAIKPSSEIAKDLNRFAGAGGGIGEAALYGHQYFTAEEVLESTKKKISSSRESFINLVAEKLKPLIASLEDEIKHRNDIIDEEERLSRPEKALKEEQEKREKELILEENRRFDETGRSSFFESFKKMIAKVFEVVIDLKGTIGSYVGPISALKTYLSKNLINYETFHIQIQDFQGIGDVFSYLFGKEFEGVSKHLTSLSPSLSERFGNISQNLVKASSIPENASFIDTDIKDNLLKLRDSLKNISGIKDSLVGIIDGFSDFDRKGISIGMFPWLTKEWVISSKYLSIDLHSIPKSFEGFDNLITDSLSKFPDRLFLQMKVASGWFEGIKILLSLKDSLKELSEIKFVKDVKGNVGNEQDNQLNLDFSVFDRLPSFLKKLGGLSDVFTQSFKERIVGLGALNVSIPQFKLYEEGVKRFSTLVSLSDWFGNNKDQIIVSNLTDLDMAAKFFMTQFFPKVVQDWVENKYDKLFIGEFVRRVVESINAFNNAYDAISDYLGKNPVKLPIHLRNEDEIFNGKSGVVTLGDENVKITCEYKVSFHNDETGSPHTRSTLERRIYSNKFSRVKDRLLYWSENGTKCKLPQAAGYTTYLFHQAHDYGYFPIKDMGCDSHNMSLPAGEQPGGVSEDTSDLTGQMSTVPSGGGAQSPTAPTANEAAEAAAKIAAQRRILDAIGDTAKKATELLRGTREEPVETPPPSEPPPDRQGGIDPNISLPGAHRFVLGGTPPEEE